MEIVEKRLTLLKPEQICFVKQIYLENNFFSGVVCYTRAICENYTMGAKNSDNHDKFGFPYDELDEAILIAFQRLYPDAFCKTSLQICDWDLEQNNLWINQREKHTIDIYFEEMVEEVLPSYTFPISHPLRIAKLSVDLYCLHGANFNIHKALQYYLYQCKTPEFDRIYDLASHTSGKI